MLKKDMWGMINCHQMMVNRCVCQLMSDDL